MGVSGMYEKFDKVILSEAENPVMKGSLDSSFHFVPFRMTLLRYPIQKSTKKQENYGK